jgi:hypothetical protein
LTVFDDGNGPSLFAAGSFMTAGGNEARNIAKWDGSTWSALGSGTDNSVFALTAFDDGCGPALYAGGMFGTAGGLAVRDIAKWDGSSWSALGGGVTGTPSYSHVHALTVFDDGDGQALVVGGNFLSAPDSGDSYLARWSCTPDTTPPTLSCPSLVVSPDDFHGPPGEFVTYSVTATDERDPSPDVVCVPPSGSFFPRGTTLVTCTATDDSGNQSTCQFQVRVEVKFRRR